jgi:hypothetical protein
LVILFPPRDWAFLAVGLPVRPKTDWTSTGFPCFARTSCDRGGCPLYSGDGGAHPDRSRSPASAYRITAARPCTPPQRHIYAELCITKHQPRVHACSPVRSSPRLWLPDATAASWASPPSFAPRPYKRRTSRWGQAIEHGPETTLYVIDLASNPTLFSQCVRPRVARDNADASASAHDRLLALASTRRRSFGWPRRDECLRGKALARSRRP